MRAIKRSDLEGKTIKAVDCGAENVLHLTFTDGSTLEIWSEVGSLLLPFMYVED